MRRLDRDIAGVKARIDVAVAAAKTSVIDVHRVGPIVAALVIGHTGDATRFASRNHYASYNGTAPLEASSGPKAVGPAPGMVDDADYRADGRAVALEVWVFEFDSRARSFLGDESRFEFAGTPAGSGARGSTSAWRSGGALACGARERAARQGCQS